MDILTIPFNEPEAIIQAIVAHPDYAKLNWVQQERITCPVSTIWLQNAAHCMLIDRNRMLAGLETHASIPSDYKPIYKSILLQMDTNKWQAEHVEVRTDLEVV